MRIHAIKTVTQTKSTQTAENKFTDHARNNGKI